MWNYFKYILLPIFFLSFHWLCLRFYLYYCSPDGFAGYLSSYITTASPICIFTLVLIEKSSNMYLNAWIFLSISGIGMLKYCYNYFTDNKSLHQKN
jgi:hypothetical protein